MTDGVLAWDMTDWPSCSECHAPTRFDDRHYAEPGVFICSKCKALKEPTK